MAGEDQSGAMPSADDVADFIARQEEGSVEDVVEPVNDNAPDTEGTNEDAPEIPGVLGTDPDLTDLDPEVRVMAEQRLKEWRADYTRKGQEIAEIRKLADQYSGGDVAAMQQALEFTHRLQTDPEFREALKQELVGQQTTPTPTGNQEVDDDFLDDDDIPSGVKSQMSALEQRLAAFEAQAQAQAQEAQRNALVAQAAADLDRQMNDIRTANPDIQDAHVDQIYLLGHATGGDLIAAHEIWRNMRNEAQSELIDSKKKIPSTIGAGRPSSNAGTPAEPITTFEQAGQAAVEFINQYRQD